MNLESLLEEFAKVGGDDVYGAKSFVDFVNERLKVKKISKCEYFKNELVFKCSRFDKNGFCDNCCV